MNLINNDYRVLDALRQYAKHVGPLHWASGCSGTECPSWVARAISAALQRCNVDITWVHRASAEIDEAKRAFILHTGGRRDYFLFIDMGDMLKTEAVNACSEGTDPEPVDLVGLFLFVCGFSCTSVSGLNTSSTKDVISQGADTATGLTFRYVVRILQRWQPVMVVLENAPSCFQTFPELVPFITPSDIATSDQLR